MVSMKYKYYLKVCKIVCRIINYLSICKMQQKILRYIVSRNNLYKIIDFLIAKVEAILPLVKSIIEEKSLYTNCNAKVT